MDVWMGNRTCFANSFISDSNANRKRPLTKNFCHKNKQFDQTTQSQSQSRYQATQTRNGTLSSSSLLIIHPAPPTPSSTNP